MKKRYFLIILILLFFSIKSTRALNNDLKADVEKIAAGIVYLKLAEHIDNKKIQFSEITTTIIIHYSTTFFTTFFHELGHAVASKLLYKSDINIHIGDNYKNKESIVKVFGISIDGFCPKKGFSILNKFREQDKIKDSIIFLAGGIFGILINISCCFLYLFYKKYKNSDQESNPPALIYKLIFYQIFEMLFPITLNGTLQQNDASQLYTKCFNCSDEKIKSLGKLAEPIFFVIIALSTLLGCDKNSPATSKILVILANFLLDKYACFSL